MSAFFDFIASVLRSALGTLNSASVWMLLSFAAAGVFHEILGAERVRRSSVCSTKVSGVFYATVTGMMIPICSCGSIPLGIGLYYSGARLGPTLAFMTSSPMINPISIILAYGLLGKEIATVYLITGFAAPMIIGVTANRFAGKELFLAKKEDGDSPAIQLEAEKATLTQKLRNGLRWSFGELAVMVSKYSVGGVLIVSLVLSAVPQSYIQRYIGDPGFISLFGITVVAAFMYVCAVGHIPLIAALVAGGAAPGVAVTFLMAGAATNFAELFTIRRTIGKRAMLMYLVMVVVISNLVGYLTNRLFPDFKPVLHFDEATRSIDAANRLIFTAPEWLRNLCSAVLVGYAAFALFQSVKKKARKA